jgi:gliding motility-associated-like protein
MLTNTVAEAVTITGRINGTDIADNESVIFTPDMTDTDGDGILDRMEDLNGNGDLEDDDTDGDGTPNYLDPDDDGDSIPTREEDPDNDRNPQNDDTDGDLIPNYLDDDDDDDQILTIDEDINGNSNLFDDDTDDDGIPNFLDPIENMVIDKLFSPNGDGINDVLQIRNAENFPNNKVSIFNRHGNLIFETTGYNNRQRGWQGIPNTGLLASGDKIVPNGTYFYVLEPNDGTETITGFFLLKR